MEVYENSLYDPKATSDDGGMAIEGTMRALIVLLSEGILT